MQEDRIRVELVVTKSTNLAYLPSIKQDGTNSLNS